MGNTVILLSHLDFLKSYWVVSLSLFFGNTYFTNMKYMSVHACTVPDPCQLHVSVHICIFRYQQFCQVIIKHIETNTFHLKTFWKADGFCCYGALLVQGYWEKVVRARETKVLLRVTAIQTSWFPDCFPPTEPNAPCCMLCAW